MNGCVAALSVNTGKVVDIEIMSSYCPTCRKISKMPRSIESETFVLLTDCKTIMGLLFVAMLETYPVFSKMLLRLCFIAHQVSRNRCRGSVPSEKIVGATTSEHCLVAKSQTKNIKAYQMKY
ncbi:hypothetical protein TNCV_3119171 [Trichonephila clavipes]|uniref:Uncharacterized protein n=1 Tax=Trichonephila clavipes TaxID=2585209 RepID=A0A8X6W9B2_TRICX|nr:hypothetical protein TNCV_3119171 [Trichonephila clavipes]